MSRFEDALAELELGARNLGAGRITLDAWHAGVQDVLARFNRCSPTSTMEPAFPTAPARSAPRNTAQQVAAERLIPAPDLDPAYCHDVQGHAA